MHGGKWRDDERMVIFTEYKTTLDYLLRRMRKRFDEERMITLFGGMDDRQRDAMKATFNDGASPVRILLATDAAAEGLNLQKHARYLLHFDCPWNPSKLEQRNGRIDRHGQPREVTIHHFVSDQDQDLKFLARLLTKANDIREDLGSANELFDEAAHRRLVDGEDLNTVVSDWERQVEQTRGRARIDADDTPLPDTDGENAAADQLQALAEEIDLDGTALRDTLETALAITAPKPLLDCDAEAHTCRLLRPDLPGWSEVVDHSLRRREPGNTSGPVMKLAFGPEPFHEKVGQRNVYSPRKDVQWMHLGHPMIQRASSALTRKRFPGAGESVSRWCVRKGEVPKGADALLLLSVEEIAVNELRETFHHWVRTVAFPIVKGKLGEPLPHATAKALRNAEAVTDPHAVEAAREYAEDAKRGVKDWLEKHGASLTQEVEQGLKTTGDQARKNEDERYKSRQGEVSALITGNTIDKLNREIEALRAARQQGTLFAESEHFDRIDKIIEEKNAEIHRRIHHHQEVEQQLKRERERIITNLLPKRHTLAGTVHVFPLTLELRLPR